MSTKRCSRCGEQKPIAAFHRHKGRSDGRQTYCKQCKSAYTRDWYQRNGEEHRRKVKPHRKSHQARNDAFMRELYSEPCRDCGLVLHPDAMEFDHVRGEKTADVSRLRNVSRKRLTEEIEKCDLVCVLCHRRRTVLRRLQASRDAKVVDFGWVPSGSNRRPFD